MVPYVNAVVAVTVMRVLLVVLLRECEGVRVTKILVCGMDEVWLWPGASILGTGGRLSH